MGRSFYMESVKEIKEIKVDHLSGNSSREAYLHYKGGYSLQGLHTIFFFSYNLILIH